MDGLMIAGIFQREDFGKFQLMQKKNKDSTEVLGTSADKFAGLSVVYKNKIEEAHEASMLLALVSDVNKTQELTRLACVFLELVSPGGQDKQAWLAENLLRLKPTEKQKTPKVQSIWGDQVIQMQHLGKMGQILIRVNQKG
jgi:predicted phage tail protein